jgi:N-methylhydantoinase A
MMANLRLGVDIGGTFTDAVLIDESDGAIRIDKVLTTPVDPSCGFIDVTRRLVQRGRVDPGALPAIIHATTVATNALLERKGADTALLVTEGFRDILEIARQVRYELYNLQTDKPPPLVSRQRCLEIRERMDHRGTVLCPLEANDVVRAAERLKSLQIPSIAVCFLHAYQNPVHEQRAAEIIRTIYPEALISLSSDIAPEIREYWRASTTVTNAYVRPLVQRYVENVERRLADDGLGGKLRIMQSSGGIMSTATAKERPILMLESGPAAGVAAAAFIGGLAGCSDAISFDMGGTTAKVGLIREGTPSVRTEFEAGSATGTGAGLARGSGYPVLAPVMDLVEIGAGGGSLAWIDPGGLLRVGPRSAGADPGPACYGRGGIDPTVTDANLVLGRLDPQRFLGGELVLDVAAAHRAVEMECARPLGIQSVEAAMGIVDITNAAMVQAMRLVSVQRGYDPRDFALIAFGGAGPVHANQLARDLGIPLVVVPPSPGVASALGMLATDLRRDYRVTRLQRLDGVRLSDLDAIFRGFEEHASAALSEEGFPPDRIRFQRYLDLRYVGQSWKLQVSLPDTDLGGREPALTGDILVQLEEQFARQHKQQYGYAVLEEPVEVVNIGLSALGLVPPPALRELPAGGESPDAALDAMHRVYFREKGGFVEAPVYDRYRLQVGNLIEGPAIIAEKDATTVVHPGSRAQVSRFGILLLEM